jgi:hypothetical protein
MTRILPAPGSGVAAERISIRVAQPLQANTESEKRAIEKNLVITRILQSGRSVQQRNIFLDKKDPIFVGYGGAEESGNRRGNQMSSGDATGANCLERGSSQVKDQKYFER